MISNNSMRDGKAKSRALAVAFLGEKWFEDVMQYFGAHAASVIDNFERDLFVVRIQKDIHLSSFINAVQGIGNQVQGDLLDGLGTDRRLQGAGAMDSQFFGPIFSQVFDHVDNSVDKFSQVSIYPGGGAHPRKIKETVRDPFHTKCFVLDSSHIFEDDVGLFEFRIAVLKILITDPVNQSTFQGFRAPGNGCHGVIDFMGNASSKETDTGELLIAYDLVRAFPDLTVESVTYLAEVRGHVIHRSRKLGQLVLRVQDDAMAEVA